MTRFAYAPLHEYLTRIHPVEDGDGPDGTTIGCRRAARLIGNVSAKTVNRWQHDGIPLDRADKIAVRLGEHPSTIWPEWWHYDPDTEDVAS